MAHPDFTFVVRRISEVIEKSPSALDGVGFALTPDRGEGRRMILMFPSHKLTSIGGVREFSRAINNITNIHDVDVAGLVARIPMKIQTHDDDTIPDEDDLEPTTLLYIDRKYGEMKMWVGQKMLGTGEEVDFKELGPPAALTDFLPSLFPMESYGVPVAEA